MVIDAVSGERGFSDSERVCGVLGNVGSFILIIH